MPSARLLRVAHFTLGRPRLDSANGVDKAVHHLASHQAALGHHIRVFSLTPKTPIEIPGVTVSTFRAPSWLTVPKELVAGILEWRPDVLHLHSVHIWPNIYLARQLSPAIPYCVTIHGGLSPFALRRNRWAKRVFGFICERKYLQRASFIHAISALDVEAIVGYGLTNPTVLAPNGIDVEPLPATSPDSSLSHSDQKLNGKRIFMYLGRLDVEQKGLDILLQAFAACRLENSVLLLVGPDWRGSQRRLEALAGSLGIIDTVVFPGTAFGEKKLELLRSANVLVQPSRTEAGVPFSVLEAAAVGCPSLLSICADPAGILVGAGTAVSVSPTVDSIAAGLRQLNATPDHVLREMGARAQDLVRKEFSWSRTAGILIDAYRTHALQWRE